MNKASVLGLATFWMSVIGAGCAGEQAAVTPALGAAAGAAAQTSAAQGTTSNGANGTDVGSASGASGATTSTAATAGVTAGNGAAAVAGTTGATAQPGVSAGTGAAQGGNGSAADSGSGAAGVDAGAGVAAAAGGSAEAMDAGSAPADASDSLDIPAPVDAPLVWGFGIGITDVPAATKFFTDAMEMVVEKDAAQRDGWSETTLYSTQAMRGARLALMNFDDMRETQKITAKVVWQAQNVAAVNTAASMYPGYVSRVNFGVVQFDGPETYIQEVGNSFDTGGTGITVPYPIAIGFAVSDLSASRQFYTSLGMTESSIGTFTVTDATGTGSITEYSVKFDEGVGIVLQQWTPMRNAKDNPVKMVLFVPDAKVVADKVVAAGGMLVKDAERSPAYDNRLLIVAKDLDGYVLDIVQ